MLVPRADENKEETNKIIPTRDRIETGNNAKDRHGSQQRTSATSQRNNRKMNEHENVHEFTGKKLRFYGTYY